MNKLKLINIGTLPFLEGQEPMENKDYLLSIRCALEEVREKAKHGEDGSPKIFVMKAERIQAFMEIGSSKQFTIRPGKTRSQILRWKLEELARVMGKNEEDLYNEIMDKNISKVEEKLDELRR